MDSAWRMWGIGSGSSIVGVHDVEERERGLKKRRRHRAMESAKALSCLGGMAVYFGKGRLARMERGMEGSIFFEVSGDVPRKYFSQSAHFRSSKTSARTISISCYSPYLQTHLKLHKNLSIYRNHVPVFISSHKTLANSKVRSQGTAHGTLHRHQKFPKAPPSSPSPHLPIQFCLLPSPSVPSK